MAGSDKYSIFLCLFTLLILLCCWVRVSDCAKKPVGIARKEDIPFIKCQVCEKLAAQLHQQVRSKEDEIAPKSVFACWVQLSELDIIQIAENLCNLKKKEADWILKIDIVEQGDKLKLVDQDSEGQCNSECKTIERACEEVLGYSDTDVAEYVYKKKPQLETLVNFICKDLTEACVSKPPPVPKDRIPGEPFIVKSAKEAEMESIMKSMEGLPGAPGMKMYSREELMSQNFGGEEDDEEEDDDDELASKLGKALKENEKKKDNKYEWKEKIPRILTEATEKVKHHANRASFRLKQWFRSWKNKGQENKKKKKKSGEL